MDSNTLSQLLSIFFCLACLGMFALIVVVVAFLTLGRKQRSTSSQPTATPTSTPPRAQQRPATATPVPTPPPAQQHSTTEASPNQQDYLTAQEYYEKAMQIEKEMLIKNGDTEFTPEQMEKKRSDLLHIASYYRLAVDHSKGRHVEASAALSFIMLLLNDLPKARQYAQMAIAQQPNNFTARYALFFLAYGDLEGYNPYIAHTSTAGTFVTIGWAMARKSGKKRNVMTAARNLIIAFQHNVQSGEKRDVKEWINMAQALLKAAETLDGYRMREPELFRVILNAPWDQIEQEEFANEVIDLRAKAEGLLHL